MCICFITGIAEVYIPASKLDLSIAVAQVSIANCHISHFRSMQEKEETKYVPVYTREDRRARGRIYLVCTGFFISDFCLVCYTFAMVIAIRECGVTEISKLA